MSFVISFILATTVISFILATTDGIFTMTYRPEKVNVATSITVKEGVWDSLNEQLETPSANSLNEKQMLR